MTSIMASKGTGMPRHRLTILVIGVFVCRVPPAAAQSIGKWTIDVHAGAGMTTNPQTGTPVGVPAAASFLISPNLPSSLAISSWYFGDGARLFNQLRSVRGLPGITPLDSEFSRPAASRQGGAVFGARVARTIVGRLLAEFSIDAVQGSLQLNQSLLDTVEASRVSFQNGFNTIFINQSTHSASTLVDDVGSRLLMTLAARIDLLDRGRFMPYATVGIGVDRPRGDSPEISLAGEYTFTTLQGVLHEFDNVTLRVETSKTAIFVFGGGLSWHLGGNSGIRADVRFHTGADKARLLLDTHHSATNAGVTGYLDLSLPTPMIFSTAVLPTNLSGPPFDGFELFKGSGTRVSTTITAGYFLRF
jgi:hypothetical protein